jgi:hypothetical protein
LSGAGGAALALCLGAALAAPPAARADEAPLAVGLETEAAGAHGARVAVRLERLAAHDWQLGPLAIRPFARALVDGGSVTVRRPAAAAAAAPGAAAAPPAPGAAPALAAAPGASQPAALPPAPGPPREAAGAGDASATAALHRLAEGLAGRELVAFRIRDFHFVVSSGDARQLDLAAQEARARRDGRDLELRGVRADTAAGQRLEAERLRLRWDPERLALRGPWRLCEGARCERGRDGELALDPRSGRLVAAARPAAAGAQAREPEQRGQR